MYGTIICEEIESESSIFAQIFLKNTTLQELKSIYKLNDKLQSSFLDFNQPMGLHMNPENRWIKMSDMIPWDAFEQKYKDLFRKRINAKMLMEANEYLLQENRSDRKDDDNDHRLVF